MRRRMREIEAGMGGVKIGKESEFKGMCFNERVRKMGVDEGVAYSQKHSERFADKGMWFFKEGAEVGWKLMSLDSPLRKASNVERGDLGYEFLKHGMYCFPVDFGESKLI